MIEGMDRRPGQIPLNVQKPQTPTPASTSSTAAHGTRNPFDTQIQEGCDQKSHRDGTGYDWSPLQPVEETVSGVVSEAENEVSDKASER